VTGFVRERKSGLTRCRCPRLLLLRGQHLELPVEGLPRRARPLPPHDEMVIEDLSEEEGAAFAPATAGSPRPRFA
jgi:hypothetical protein